MWLSLNLDRKILNNITADNPNILDFPSPPPTSPGRCLRHIRSKALKAWHLRGHGFFWRVHMQIFTEIGMVWSIGFHLGVSVSQTFLVCFFLLVLYINNWSMEKIGKYMEILPGSRTCVQIASKHFWKLQKLLGKQDLNMIKHEVLRSILSILSSYVVKPTQSLPPSTPPHRLQHHCLSDPPHPPLFFWRQSITPISGNFRSSS